MNPPVPASKINISQCSLVGNKWYASYCVMDGDGQMYARYLTDKGWRLACPIYLDSKAEIKKLMSKTRIKIIPVSDFERQVREDDNAYMTKSMEKELKRLLEMEKSI